MGSGAFVSTFVSDYVHSSQCGWTPDVRLYKHKVIHYPARARVGEWGGGVFICIETLINPSSRFHSDQWEIYC